MRKSGLAVSFVAASLVASGCGSPKSESFRWPSSPGLPVGQPPSSVVQITERDGSVMRVAGETVIRADQKVDGAIVRGGWIKNIRNSRGELVYADGKTFSSLPFAAGAVVKKFSEDRPRILEAIRKQVPLIQGASRLMGPELEIVRERGARVWKLRWVLHYIDSTQENAWRVEANTRGRVLKVQKTGSQFVDGQAIVFPKGPALSALSNVVLRQLVGDGSLTSPKLRIVSAIAQGAHSDQHVFDYDPTDSRFDDVQAYYFVDQAIDWFKSNAGIDLPFDLDVVVHVGGLTPPTNTAYYFHGNIRLGAGDGQVYHNIPRDPSIVMHETSHAYVESIAGLPYEGQGGSLNEAFADFFAATMLDNPNMGEVAYALGPYKRTLTNAFKVSEANGGLYHDSLIVSGTLWDIKKAMGSQKAVAFALKTLARLNSDSQLLDFKTAAQYAESDLLPDEVLKVEAALKTRGW